MSRLTTNCGHVNGDDLNQHGKKVAPECSGAPGCRGCRTHATAAVSGVCSIFTCTHAPYAGACARLHACIHTHMCMSVGARGSWPLGDLLMDRACAGVMRCFAQRRRTPRHAPRHNDEQQKAEPRAATVVGCGHHEKAKVTSGVGHSVPQGRARGAVVRDSRRPWQSPAVSFPTHLRICVCVCVCACACARVAVIIY